MQGPETSKTGLKGETEEFPPFRLNFINQRVSLPLTGPSPESKMDIPFANPQTRGTSPVAEH